MFFSIAHYLEFQGQSPAEKQLESYPCGALSYCKLPSWQIYINTSSIVSIHDKKLRVFFSKIASVLQHIGFRTLYFIWCQTRPVLLIWCWYLQYARHQSHRIKKKRKNKNYSLSQWTQKGKRATNRWKEDFWQELAFRNDLALFWNILLKIYSSSYCGITAQGSTVWSNFLFFSFFF